MVTDGCRLWCVMLFPIECHLSNATLDRQCPCVSCWKKGQLDDKCQCCNAVLLKGVCSERCHGFYMRKLFIIFDEVFHFSSFAHWISELCRGPLLLDWCTRTVPNLLLLTVSGGEFEHREAHRFFWLRYDGRNHHELRKYLDVSSCGSCN